MCIYQKNHVLRKIKKGVVVRKMAFWLNMGSCGFDSICLKNLHKKGQFMATNTPIKEVHRN